MKICKKCNILKDLQEFPKNRNECTPCKNERHKKWHKDNYKRSRDLSMKRDYGITSDEYDKCMATSNKCEICGATSTLVYDHNHITNEFRGVLCSACNKGLGLLKDSIVILNNAVAYLKNKGSYNTVTLET